MTILIYLKNPGTRILYIKTSPQIHIYMYLLKIPIDILSKKRILLTWDNLENICAPSSGHADNGSKGVIYDA